MTRLGRPIPQAHSPAVARLFVRVALRGARETESMTQGEVAKSLDWSLSKIQRIESGEVTVSTTDLMAMMRHFGNVTAEDADRLIELVRVSRKGTGWWDQPAYKAHLSQPTLELIQFEGEATVIRAFNPLVVPGLLQIPAYASSVFDKWNPAMAQERKQAKLEVRRLRGDKFFARQARPDYRVLLDESVLHRSIGAVDVMVDQLNYLLGRVDAGLVTLGILKLDTALPHSSLPFTLLGFGEQDDGGALYSLLYEEASPHDRITSDAGQLSSYQSRFDRMWQTASTGSDAQDLLCQRLKDLRRKKRGK